MLWGLEVKDPRLPGWAVPGILMVLRSFLRAVRAFTGDGRDRVDGWTGLVVGSTVAGLVLFAWVFAVVFP